MPPDQDDLLQPRRVYPGSEGRLPQKRVSELSLDDLRTIIRAIINEELDRKIAEQEAKLAKTQADLAQMRMQDVGMTGPAPMPVPNMAPGVTNWEPMRDQSPLDDFSDEVNAMETAIQRQVARSVGINPELVAPSTTPPRPPDSPPQTAAPPRDGPTSWLHDIADLVRFD